MISKAGTVAGSKIASVKVDVMAAMWVTKISAEAPKAQSDFRLTSD